MPELLLELFSEEIPARMQARAASDLERLVAEAVAALHPQNFTNFAGPRRIAVVGTISAEQPGGAISERGPRIGAPDGAIAGFARKHGATREQLTQGDGYWLLNKTTDTVTAATVLGSMLPSVLRRFPWPKTMRWGSGSEFTWVRPLRRILCMIDGVVVPFSLADGTDSGHSLEASNQTEGHRFHAPAPFAVASAAEWETGLLERRVIAAAAQRRRLIEAGITKLAAAEGLTVVPDEGLLDEVAGLVEWPVPLLGSIDPHFMDLPAEVMQVSMRVNQRYFALRSLAGAAPRFAFVANIEAEDGGATIIAGNERVLRARFSDARHFWDLDRRTKLADRVDALEKITFHAKLGSQGARIRRLRFLARHIAPLVGADPDQVERAARLAKADLTSGMVGEFPELQGVMGSYYAAHDGEAPAVAAAIRDHYAPKGPTDPVPSAPVSIAVALADKIDQLAGFFAVGEIPTGSGDPYALRRAALGLIRIIRENHLRLNLLKLFHEAQVELPAPVPTSALLDFIADRLRVQLRAEGERHDVLAAVFAAGADDDILRLLARTDALARFLATSDGTDLLAGARRAANILRIEDKKDGLHRGPVDPGRLQAPEERALDAALAHAQAQTANLLEQEDFGAAMGELARLRPALDAFFDKVTVNASDPDLRENRLRLLAHVGAAMDRTADFSRIEG